MLLLLGARRRKKASCETEMGSLMHMYKYTYRFMVDIFEDIGLICIFLCSGDRYRVLLPAGPITDYVWLILTQIETEQMSL